MHLLKLSALLVPLISFAVAFTPSVHSALSAPGLTMEDKRPEIGYEDAFMSESDQTAAFKNENVALDNLLSRPGENSLTPADTHRQDERVFFVSPRGSDDALGTNAAPWKSIQHAVNQLNAGDRLTLLEGVYNETVDLSVSGNQKAWITIEGSGQVVIDRGQGKKGFESDGTRNYDPTIDTNGQSFIRIKNLEVHNSRAAVEVNGGSYVEIDNLKSSGNDFAVKIDGASNVVVRNVHAENSRNAFRTEGDTRNVLFENIETLGSEDAYKGYKTRRDFYLNGDGFILEEGTNITLRNIASYNHWDAGFDIKANNVTLDNVVAFGNKNNFKTWGDNIVINNALSFGAKRQSEEGSPVQWDGNGINVRRGTLKIINSTFVDNEDFDIKMTNDAAVTLEKSVVARRGPGDGRLLAIDGGYFRHEENLWYDDGLQKVEAEGFRAGAGEKWGAPGFVSWGKDYNLTGAEALKLGYNGTRQAHTPGPIAPPVVSQPADLVIYAEAAAGGYGNARTGERIFVRIPVPRG